MVSNISGKNRNDLVAEERIQQPHPASEAEGVGLRLNEIRTQQGWTLKSLAEHSKLNINTLSMIEKGKTIPSVGTLQRLARVLNVPITTLFESDTKPEQIIFTAHDHRPETTCCEALIQNLGKNLQSNGIEPFVVNMPSHAGSGGRSIIHSGFEFAYCLSGKVLYHIQEVEYPLEAGDSLVFAAKLPHRWENILEGESQMILVLTPGDELQSQGKVHFHGA